MDERRARFEAEVLPHLDAAYRLARWLARAPGDADDVVQEAVLRAFRGFDSLRSSDATASRRVSGAAKAGARSPVAAAPRSIIM